jgi:hypothetical protein
MIGSTLEKICSGWNKQAAGNKHAPAPKWSVIVLTAAAMAVSLGGRTSDAADSDAATVKTIAQLAAQMGLAPSALVRVEGYRAPGDGGGGLFRYEPDSRLTADGGAVVKLESAPGRMIRVVDPDEDVFAEWFGAYGDGDAVMPHDDQQAINQCLSAYGRVRLLAKTYGVRGKPEVYNAAVSYHALDLGPYFRIIGSGRERTKIKLLAGTNPRGGGPGDNYFTIISNRAFHESAEHIVISDLSIDCNFDAQDKHTTIHAVAIRGGGGLVERVNFRGYGTGRSPESGSSRECFVVHQTLVFKDAGSCRRAAVYRDLDFTDCGHNGMLDGGVAEITHIALGGANNFENAGWIMPQGRDPEFDPTNGGENEKNWWPAYGGLVENCVIHDEEFEPAVQKSPLNGITYGDCIGLTVRGNRVENWEGSAVFTMSWWNRNTVIVDNLFRGVTNGIVLNMASTEGKPIQCPRHENVLIANNQITLGAHRNAPWGTCGVSLFGGEMPAVLRMSGIHVRANSISGRAYIDAKGTRVCPIGIKVQILRPTYHDIRFEDNALDLPDYADAVNVPQVPFGQSMMYFPLALWADATKAGHVLFRNNRSPAGKPLYPFLADWDFKNAPVLGKP